MFVRRTRGFDPGEVRSVTIGDAAKFETWWKRAVARGEGAHLHVAHADGAAADPVDELVFAMLLWNTTTEQARGAYSAIRREVVDNNELRVCSPADIVQIIGASYPLALERAIRLRQALGDIFAHHASMTLPSHHHGEESLAMLGALQGVPFACAARVALVCWDVPVLPVDDVIAEMLVHARVLKAATPCDVAAHWLLTQTKPAPPRITAAILQASVDAHQLHPSAGKRLAPELTSRSNRGKGVTARKSRTKKQP